MTEKVNKTLRKYQDTYIYIDVSNIRSACLKTLGFRIDFVRLLDYFKQKYPNLREVRYYEGIATNDTKRRRMFNFLERKGYTICALKRKSYNFVEVEKQNMKCPRCGYGWNAESAKERKMMKSNVDVYLASDMLVRASVTNCPVRLILVSCDGDYAEAIRNMLNLNENVSVSVLATPKTKELGKNTLSVRLKDLLNELPRDRYSLNYVDAIKQRVATTK